MDYNQLLDLVKEEFRSNFSAYFSAFHEYLELEEKGLHTQAHERFMTAFASRQVCQVLQSILSQSDPDFLPKTYPEFFL